jgi:four helix bundle protein
MGPTKRFTELLAWQKAHEFTREVYRLTSVYPREEMYGLTSQFRRASVSVSANIAESYGRRGKDKLKFLHYAYASLQECKYYIILSVDLHYLKESVLDEQADLVARLLHSYMQAIRQNATTLS